MKESRFIEYKSEITGTFLKTVSAFSNFGSGEIIFGVNDDGTVCGIDNPEKACLDIENRINDSISPKPDFTLSVNMKKSVITLSVTEGNYKPYFYKGKAYRRSDASTVPVDDIELKRLILEGSNMYYEELPCEMQELKFEYFENVLKNKLGVEKLTADIIKTLGLTDKSGKYTVAAGLFADKNPYYGTDIARFGESVSEILDRETYSNISVLKQFSQAVAMYRRYYQSEYIVGTDRINFEKIPERAFREAIANALIHRTWDINSHIKISMFSDRIEIVSPGGLPDGITEKEYLAGNISNFRNPVTGNIFFRLNYIEMFGTGITRIKEAYRDSVCKPSFGVFDNSISVTLPVMTKKYEVTTDQQKIIEILGTGIVLSSSEIVKKTGWSKNKVVRLLNKLIEAGYISSSGTGRGTKYSVKNK